jgi:hypothetical protein
VSVVSTYPSNDIVIVVVVSLLIVATSVHSLSHLLSPSQSVGVGSAAKPVRVVLASYPPRSSSGA